VGGWRVGDRGGGGGGGGAERRSLDSFTEGSLTRTHGDPGLHL